MWRVDVFTSKKFYDRIVDLVFNTVLFMRIILCNNNLNDKASITHKAVGSNFVI